MARLPHLHAALSSTDGLRRLLFRIGFFCMLTLQHLALLLEAMYADFLYRKGFWRLIKSAPSAASPGTKNSY